MYKCYLCIFCRVNTELLEKFWRFFVLRLHKIRLKFKFLFKFCLLTWHFILYFNISFNWKFQAMLSLQYLFKLPLLKGVPVLFSERCVSLKALSHFSCPGILTSCLKNRRTLHVKHKLWWWAVCAICGDWGWHIWQMACLRYSIIGLVISQWRTATFTIQFPAGGLIILTDLLFFKSLFSTSIKNIFDVGVICGDSVWVTNLFEVCQN